MRRYLFKGKVSSEYKWMSKGDWIEGNLLYDKNNEREICQIVTSYLSNDKEELIAITYDVDPETVCQYTGLNDNTKWEELSEKEKDEFLSKWNYKEKRQNVKEDWHGRKIFEGDICKTKFFGKENGKGQNFSEYDIFKISYRDGIYLLENNLRQFSAQYIPDMAGYGIEIIGNIFDNPELIAGHP